MGWETHQVESNRGSCGKETGVSQRAKLCRLMQLCLVPEDTLTFIYEILSSNSCHKKLSCNATGGNTHTHTRARRHKISIVKFQTHFLPLSPESKSYNPDMLQATRIRAEHPPLFHFFTLSISLFSMRARPSKLSLNPGQLQCGQEECTVRLGRKERGGVG